jgi:hypothetical protein
MVNEIICQKCGGTQDWKVVYCGGRSSNQAQIGCFVISEHLHNTCPICGYMFIAPTYDNYDPEQFTKILGEGDKVDG